MGSRLQQETLGEILVAEADIQRRVKEMAEEIARDYEGKPLLVVGILKGAVVFLSDLIRALPIPVAVDFMAVQSYGVSTRHSGVVRITKDLDQSIEGRDVLIVEDIVDTGLTLQYLQEILRAREPASLKTAVFLDKPERRIVPVPVDYVGFAIPDRFVVGYGLDYAERYRNLRHVAVLRVEEAQANA